MYGTDRPIRLFARADERDVKVKITIELIARLRHQAREPMSGFDRLANFRRRQALIQKLSSSN
jgi:hypothetical protein